MVEILYSVVLLHISSQLCIQFLLDGSSKLAMARVFIPQKLANSTNQGIFPPKEPVKYSLAY